MKLIIPILVFGRAGGYRVLSKLADELLKNGHDVTFITSQYSAPAYYPTHAKIIIAESPFSNIPVIRVVFGLFAIWRKILSMESGHVLANHNITAYIAFMLPRSFKKIYYIQAYEVNFSSRWPRKLLAYFSYSLPLKKIVNSKNLLPKEFPNTYSVVPAGIDLELFSRNPKTYNKSRQIKIGCIGRIERHKGTAEIIEAFSKIAKKYDAALNIAIHTPPVPEEIKHLVNEFKISSDKELSEFYDKNDIIVATGLIENGAFHYPCAEGMASGKIIISNYAPLIGNPPFDFSSPLTLSNVTADEIFKSLTHAINMTESAQLSEIKKNKEIISSYSWDIIGKKFIRAILD